MSCCTLCPYFSLFGKFQLLIRSYRQREDDEPSRKPYRFDAGSLMQRLQDIASGQEDAAPKTLEMREAHWFLPTASSADLSDSSACSVDLFTRTVRDEKIDHDRLVKLGGRPLYSAEKIPLAASDKKEDEKLGRPVRTATSDSHQHVFQTQLARWERFLNQQRSHRGIGDERELDFDLWAEEKRRKERRRRSSRSYKFWHAKNERKPERLLDNWETWKSSKESVRAKFTAKAFRDYITKVKTTLASRGMHQPCEFKEDHRQQDRLTTWMEYLATEYRSQDELKERLELETRRLELEQAWQEIIDSNVLQPPEKNREYVDRFKNRPLHGERVFSEAPVAELEKFKEKKEKNQGKVDGKSSEDLRTEEEDLERKARRGRQLDNRRARPGELLAKYREVQKKVMKAERILENQIECLQWAERQIPLIEAEMAAGAESPDGFISPVTGSDAEPTETASEGREQGKSRKRAYSGNDSDEENRTSKKVKGPDLDAEMQRNKNDQSAQHPNIRASASPHHQEARTETPSQGSAGVRAEAAKAQRGNRQRRLSTQPTQVIRRSSRLAERRRKEEQEAATKAEAAKEGPSRKRVPKAPAPQRNRPQRPQENLRRSSRIPEIARRREDALAAAAAAAEEAEAAAREQALNRRRRQASKTADKPGRRRKISKPAKKPRRGNAK